MPKWWLPIISALMVAGQLLAAVIALCVFLEVQFRLTRSSKNDGSAK